jgi:hypothetical protein
MNIHKLYHTPGALEQLEYLLTNINAYDIGGYTEELEHINYIYSTYRFGSYDERKQIANIISPPLPSNDINFDKIIHGLTQANKILTYSYERSKAALEKSKDQLTNIQLELDTCLQELTLEIATLTTKVNDMEPDYERYQFIKEFESISKQLQNIYDWPDTTSLTDAIYEDPHKAIDLLGANPGAHYTVLRRTRNLIAHAIV